MRRTLSAVVCVVLVVGTLAAAGPAHIVAPGATPHATPHATRQDAFVRVLQDVSAYRERGFTLPLPAGVPARYARRMEDVSAARYAAEAAALSGFAERLAAIDRAALTPAEQTDAEILSRQLRDRLAELRFRAFEIPIGSREGFHFDLAVLPDRYAFDSINQYDDYIATLQSFGEHTVQRIAQLRAGLRECDLVIVATINAWQQPGQAALVRALLADGLPTVVAALRLPYDLTAFPEAPTFVCAYSIMQPSLEALAAALWGAAPVEGRLPVSIPGLYPAAS